MTEEVLTGAEVGHGRRTFLRPKVFRAGTAVIGARCSGPEQSGTVPNLP